MLTFLHAADFHLDAPFAALPPERAAQRRGEQRELLDRMAQLARDRQVDLVLLAGDLMDSEQTYAETAQALSRALAAIPAPVFIAPGNHDFWSEHSLYATMSWPENVHIFTQAAPSASWGVPCMGLPLLPRAVIALPWSSSAPQRTAASI